MQPIPLANSNVYREVDYELLPELLRRRRTWLGRRLLPHERPRGRFFDLR